MFSTSYKHRPEPSMKVVANIRLLALVAALSLGIANSGRSQSFQDLFANRQTVTTGSGQLSGDNSAASVEVGEPKHARKTGGHSLWVSWLAPANGVARFKTETSGFDTLLAAYYFNSTNDTTFDKLVLAAANDDSEELGDRESTIEFGVRAGQRFEIAVDGYFGAMGTVKMRWTLDVTPNAPPVILGTSPDTTLRIGVPVTLGVAMTNIPNGTKFQWLLNGVELLDEKSTNLVISSMQVTNVGRYKLLIDVGSHITFFSPSTELQINTEGANALAESKFPDAPASALLGSDGGGFSMKVSQLSIASAGPTAQSISSFGVVQGYTGSQIFNTTYATTDPAEPIHCNTPGGASYWLTYQPPANGTITLDTIGSSYDTVMEIYSYNLAPTSYQDLISLACDHDGVAGGSRVQLAVVRTRQYLVAVAGVNGARGTAYLNYNLNTNQPPQPPVLAQSPQTVAVTNGADVVLAPVVSGTPPLHFAWARNSTPITNSNFPNLSLFKVSPIETGNYSVTITNDLGSVTAVIPLHVVTPPNLVLAGSASNALLITLPTQQGFRYFIEEAMDVCGPWQLWTNAFIGDGNTLTVPLPMTSARDFYRVRVQ